ncbi:transglutaminase-like domain-containing protein [Paenibacillus campi]|uniref:transglutaminase-like domain-containing protein n=1 Tax=Paenibacillus campi TaxID=3106031 RepID=UPI002AFEB03F|nr:transglutaminase-like domain-containing protein [Paenibacillus sp. SGZ-1009]
MSNITAYLDTQRIHIQQRLEWKRKQASQREQELFAVLDQMTEPEERELLAYLYAYMPLHDLADYDGDVYAKHVRHVLQTRQHMHWGQTIPDELFVQYVLPYRVNNENIDDSRQVIYHLLVDRVRSLSMTDAIIETNYWCHEHATYTGTDIRTVSALTLLRTALGRCGEQSTLTVTALRSIGIPARQCYTPRWAHCDSNHAWVEAWADGKWHYLGACEPEAVLNEGWFRLPAKRAMLIHTRVPADYDGAEEVCSSHPWYTEINLLTSYADTKRLHVQTNDENGQPIVAEVQFQQYNAAEFHPLATLQTDQSGKTALTTGYGDLLLHARTPDGAYGGASFVSSRQTSMTLTLKRLATAAIVAPEQLEKLDTTTPLSDSPTQPYTMDWIVQPPPAPTPEPGPAVSEAARHVQEQRVQEGTAMRTAYEQTFLTAEAIVQLATRWQLPAERLLTVLQTARGNGAELSAFLEQTKPEQRLLALQLLESLRPKDWQDTNCRTLNDHLRGAVPYVQHEHTAQTALSFQRYILCPRVHVEMIAPYREYLSSRWEMAAQQQFRAEPQRLAAQLQQEVTLLNDIDRYSGMATPVGSHRLGVADSLSRAILFVAAARTLGIAARLEPLYLLPQYWQEGRWQDAHFTDERSRHSNRGVAEDAANELPLLTETATEQENLLGIAHATPAVAGGMNEAGASNRGYICVQLEQPATGMQTAPVAYYQDFTLALLNNGLYETLQFPYGDQMMTDQTHEVLAGSYRLTTGTRLRDGSVLGRFTFFQVQPGQTIEIKLQLRRAEEAVPILAQTLPTAVLAKVWGDEAQYDIAAAGTELKPLAYPTVIAWLEPEREPTKHVLRELAELQQLFSGRYEPIVLLLQSAAEQGLLEHNLLPEQSVIRLDERLQALHALSGTLAQQLAVLGEQRPVVLVLDRQARVRFAVQGYKPGTATDLLQVLDQLMPDEA